MFQTTVVCNMEVFVADCVQILSGLRGAEGPVFDHNGNMYMVAPEVEDSEGKPTGEVLKVDLENEQCEILCAPRDGHDGGIPAGCQCDRHGNVWVADMRLGLLKVTRDGHFKQITRRDFTYKQMQGCNDLSFDYDGNLWITAPAGKIAPDRYQRSSKEGRFGSIYWYSPTNEIMRRIDTGYAFSNGIAVQHSKTGRPLVLIVAETQTKLLWAYDIKGPGKVENRRIWAKVPGDHDGGPDGMDFDEEGNLLVANWGSGYLEVFPPSGGSPFCRIQLPFAKPSNLHFEPNSRSVYVTEHDSHGLWKFNWKHKGKPQYCDI